MFAVIVFFVSCQKILEHWPKGQGNQVDCKIKKVIYPDFELKYYYGSKGLLDSIIRSPENSFYGTDVTFLKYDQQKRLVEYAAYYSRDPDDYVEIHHYKYAGNRVLQDTGFFRIAGVYTQVLDLEYDIVGRIIKTSGISWTEENPSLIEPSYTMKYAYDNNGNLNKVWFNDILTTYDQFDNKVNFLRTDQVLQFLGRNYGMNNSLPGPTSYNNKGLPTTFVGDPIDPYSATGIEYKCK